MTNHIRALMERAASDQEQPPSGTPIRFTASTETIGRDGLVIDQSGWQLDEFRASPSILWSHDYLGSRPAIGRADKVWVEDKRLMVDILFDQSDDFAKSIERKYRDGHLSSVSVGWDTVQIEPPKGADGAPRVTKATLLDISAVNVPGDPGALMERQKRAYKDMGLALLELADVPADEQPNPITKTPDPKPDDASAARATWAETAASMVRLFHPFAQGPDAERESEYRRLAREYGRHGKTAPEFLSVPEVDALSVDDIRAHFLEGEPELLTDTFAAMETRAGAVLSKRNRDDLASAVALIQGVVERAQKEAEQTDEERTAEESLRNLRRIFDGDQTP